MKRLFQSAESTFKCFDNFSGINIDNVNIVIARRRRRILFIRRERDGIGGAGRRGQIGRERSLSLILGLSRVFDGFLTKDIDKKYSL